MCRRRRGLPGTDIATARGNGKAASIAAKATTAVETTAAIFAAKVGAARARQGRCKQAVILSIPA